jgi:SAM-dependent methyltransferase
MKLPNLYNFVLHHLKINPITKTEMGYRFYLKIAYGAGKPLGFPRAPWMNAALQTLSEVQDAVEQVKTLGLPENDNPPKNWDSLAALNCILDHSDQTANILDAGTVLHSMILPWLFLYGYKHLTGINLAFDRPLKLGAIEYEYGDITQTRFDENTFDAIVCQSVIEHGIIVRAYLKEMSRILKPNGILITSTDYSADPIDTKDFIEYGHPWHIFTKDEILEVFEIAREFELELTGAVDLNSQQKPVTWNGKDYTFIVFAMQKRCS